MVRFQCQDKMPESASMRAFYPLIRILGMKLLTVYYARKFQASFNFPEVKSIHMDDCRQFLDTHGGQWTQGGLFHLYSEQFSYEDPLSSYGYYDSEEDAISLSDISCAVFGSIYGNTGYVPGTCGEDVAGDELLEFFQEYASEIIHDKFEAKKPVPYPDDRLGEVVSNAFDAVANFIECADGTTEFQHRAAYEWVKLLNCIFDNCEENSYAVLSYSHPEGERILKYCEEHKDHSFYGMAHDVMDACLKQLFSSTCETGEDPVWYEASVVKRDGALSISIIYIEDNGFDISSISMAQHLFMQVINAVEERLKKEGE